MHDALLTVTSLNFLMALGMLILGWKLVAFTKWLQATLLPWIVKIGTLVQDDYDHPPPTT